VRELCALVARSVRSSRNPRHWPSYQLRRAEQLREAFDKAGIEYRARMDHPTTGPSVVVVASKPPLGVARLKEGPIRSRETAGPLLEIQDRRIVREIDNSK
jgi:hypothetical protein